MNFDTVTPLIFFRFDSFHTDFAFASIFALPRVKCGKNFLPFQGQTSVLFSPEIGRYLGHWRVLGRDVARSLPWTAPHAYWCSHEACSRSLSEAHGWNVDKDAAGFPSKVEWSLSKGKKIPSTFDPRKSKYACKCKICIKWVKSEKNQRVYPIEIHQFERFLRIILRIRVFH